MRTWCLVEHWISGRVSVGEYDHCLGDLQVNGLPAGTRTFSRLCW
jgi:hypothetical protein